MIQIVKDDTNADNGQHLGLETGNESCDNFVESCVTLRAEMTIGSNFVKESLLCSLNMGKELFLELSDLCWVNFVQESSDTTVDDGNLHGMIVKNENNTQT